MKNTEKDVVEAGFSRRNIRAVENENAKSEY